MDGLSKHALRFWRAVVVLAFTGALAFPWVLRAETVNESLRILGVGRINQLQVSSDLRYLAVGAPGGVSIWQLDSLTCVYRFDTPASRMAFSPDSTTLLTESGTEAWIYDLVSGTLQHTLRGHTDSIYSLCWSPDGTRVATGSFDCTVRFWDAATGRLLRVIYTPHFAIAAVAISPDLKYLATGSNNYDDPNTRVWDTTTGQLVREIETSFVHQPWFTPDSACLLCNRDLIDLGTGGVVRSFDSGTGLRVDNARLWDNGRRLTLSEDDPESDDDHAWVWDVESGALIASFGVKGHATSMTWGGHILTETKTFLYGDWFLPLTLEIHTYDSSTGALVRTQDLEAVLLEHNNLDPIATFSPDGRKVHLYDEQRLRTYDRASGRLLSATTIPSVAARVHGGFSANGKFLAVGYTKSGAGPLCVYDTSDGRLLNQFNDLGLPSSEGVAISSSGALVLSLPGAHVWDVGTGTLRHTLRPGGSAGALAPDGRHALTRNFSRQCKVWDTTSGELLHTISAELMFWSAAFLPDGTAFLACLDTGEYDYAINLYSVANGQMLRSFSGKGGITCYGFSPNGDRFAAGPAYGYGGVVRLWDMATGTILHEYYGHSASWDVRSVALSPDGKYLVSTGGGGGDSTCRLWLTSGNPVQLTTRRLADGRLELSWTKGTLEETADLGQTWTDTETTGSPHIFEPTAARRYYRVRVE